MIARVLAAALALASPARAEVAYRLDLAERAAHRLTVEMTVDRAAAPLALSMPVWTPGAYELRTWGKNVTPLDAVDGQGHALTLRRTGPSSFVVEGHAAGASVTLRYRVFASLLSDDASQVDAAHAYLNGTSIFLVAHGAERTRHLVRVALPAGWRAASPLDETPSGWEALGYEALVDAPLELGRFAAAEVRVAGRRLRVAVDGASAIPPSLLHDLQALVETEARLVGPPPWRRYLFLVHLSDGLGRVAALEHAAATSVLVPSGSLERGEQYDELLYVAAHELFHAWNARRLRPAELVPYDLTRAQSSRSLWLTEGITEYYAHRALRLSGRWSRARYLERLGVEATRALQAAELGRTIEEDAELTWQPPDDTAADPDAYYARGHLVALALDASLRLASDGAHTLDEVMRALLAAADAQGGVLPLDGARLAAEIARLGDAQTAARVAEWTQAPREPERLGEALAALGLALHVERGAAHTVAGFVADGDGGTLRVAAVAPTGPAADAGLRAGDRIVRLDGAAPGERWAQRLASQAPGTRVALEAVRAARPLHLELYLEAARPLACRIVEAPATPRITALREALLGP